MIEVPTIFQTKTKLIYPPNNNIIFEEYFMNYYKNNNISSDYIYLPIIWTNFYISRDFGNSDMTDLQDFLNNLDKTKKYFTIIQYDDGILQNIEDLDILVFGQGGGGNKIVPDKNLGYPIPLICNPNPFRNINIQKDILCSFVGVIEGRHRIREKIKSLYSNDFIIKSSVGYNEFTNIMERSIFSLCPRGYGATSYRICESLQHSSIPIYIYDKPWIPWKNEFDFNDIGILIHENEIPNILNIIKSKTENDIKKYLDNGNNIYNEYFTFDGCAKNIIKKITNDIC